MITDRLDVGDFGSTDSQVLSLLEMRIGLMDDEYIWRRWEHVVVWWRSVYIWRFGSMCLMDDEDVGDGSWMLVW